VSHTAPKKTGPRSQAEMRKSDAPLTRRGERTRQSLIDAARVVFERDGFINARITDITAEAGVASGSFYTYFESKEAIFAALSSQVEVSMFPAGTGGSVRTGTALEAVEAIEAANRRYLQAYRENAAFMRLLDEVAMINPDIAAVRQARSRHGWERISQGLARLQELELIRQDLDPDYMALALAAMVSRYASTWFTHAFDIGRELDFEESVRTLTVLWASAIGLDLSGWSPNAGASAPPAGGRTG
jgi:AcrR family transcriptional regulator